MSSRTFGRPRDDAERADFARLLHQSFVSESTPDTIEEWFTLAGSENLRVLRENEEVIAGLIAIPMGIFLGGSSVPTTGVAGVAVSPAHRGRGAGRELMRQACEEFREKAPLSSLYASNYGIYPSVGYERCGGRFLAGVSLRDLPRSERSLDVRMMTTDDTEAVKQLYRECARHQDGALDRGPYVWGRVEKPRLVKTLHSWLVHENGELVGFARWHQPESRNQGESTGSSYDLDVIDMAATSGRAIRRLLTLFADHSSIAGSLHFQSGPDDPFLMELPDRYFTLELGDLWMVRVLDVEGALLARGYPSHVSGELHFAVDDPTLAANGGHYVLHLDGGKAHVERGGDGRLRVDARSFAALYTGYLTPGKLALLGGLDAADPQSLELAQAAFTGPLPWCRDMY